MRQNHVTSLPANDILYIVHSIKQMGTDLEKIHDALQERDRLLRSGMFEWLLNGLVYTPGDWDEARRLFVFFRKFTASALSGEAAKTAPPVPTR